MSYSDTLGFILLGLVAYALLFLSRNKYVAIVIAILSSYVMVMFGIFLVVVIGMALLVSFFIMLITGHSVFGSMMGEIFGPLQALGKTLFIYLLAATPFLLTLRRRPDLRKWTLLAIGGALLACALVSGASFWWGRADYLQNSHNVTAATLPQRPGNIALKRSVFVKRIDSWDVPLYGDASCDSLCDTLLTDAGVTRVRMTKVRNDEFGQSSRSSVVYWIGQNQECIQQDTPAFETDLKSGKEVIVRRSAGNSLPPGQCIVGKRESAADRDFVEIALQSETAINAWKVELVEISDLAMPGGSPLLRSVEKDINFISFPPMFESGGELRRSTLRYGMFREGGFDDVFRQVLVDKLGYKIPLSKG